MGDLPTSTGEAVKVPACWGGALAAEAVRVRKLQAAEQGSKEEWVEHIRDAFLQGARQEVADEGAKEWHTGACDSKRQAAGALIVAVLDAERGEQVTGGESRARWTRQGESASEDGWREGHEQETARLRALVSFDDDGWPTDGTTGVRLQLDGIGDLEPALQLECRARMELGTEVDVLQEGGWVKREGKTHVARDVQWANHVELCTWQARVGFDLAFTFDASQKVRTNADGIPVRNDVTGELEQVASCAAGRHDGQVLGGKLLEKEGINNYLGELAAQLVALGSGNW